MRHKIKKAAALCLTLCLLSGCGKVQTENSTSGTEKLSSSASPETDTASSSEIAQSNENFLNQTEEPRQTPVPRNASVSMKKPYSDRGFWDRQTGERKVFSGSFPENWEQWR